MGVGLIAWCLLWTGRFFDRVDRYVVLSLLLFVLTCVLSEYPGMSFRAATTALAVCAGFLIARDLLADESRRSLLIVALGLCCFALSMVFLVLWGAIWLHWLSIRDAGLPPLDLVLPFGPYRHYHVIGMTVAMLSPALVILVSHGRLVRAFGLVGILAAALVVLMSGSRTAWLATTFGMSVPLVVQGVRRLRLIPFVASAAAIVVSVTLVALVTPIADRIIGTSTLRVRADIWAATIDRWLAHPLFGSGPGSYSSTLAQSDYYSRVPDLLRHADNAVIQMLAEGGLLGLAAIALLAIAIVVGVRQSPYFLWAPMAGVLIFLLSSLTDNPSDTTSLVVIGLAWTALAIPRIERRAKSRPRWVHRRVRAASLVAGAVVAATTTLTLLADWSFDQAGIAARTGDGNSVVRYLSSAVRLDPSQPLYWRELGVWRAALGNPARAAHDLGVAFDLNPGDATAARSLALIASNAGEDRLALQWARRAVALGGTHAANRLTLALVATRAGEPTVATQALIPVVRFSPWITAAPDWATTFPTGPALHDLLDAAQREAERDGPSGSTRLQLAEAWLASMTGALPDHESPNYARAAAAIIDCRFAEAETAIGAMTHREAVTVDGLRARVLVASATNDGALSDIAVLAALRWPLLGILVSQPIIGATPFTDPLADITLYRRLPIVASHFGERFPTADSGMSAWFRDPATAADRGAPGSGLSTCE